ncbi:hypothetical protein IJS77_00490 [bacterium]|nr:hypothetical protein [bacterium]
MKKIIILGLICVITAIAAILFTETKAISYSQNSMKIINQLGVYGFLNDLTGSEIDEVLDYIEKNPDKVSPWKYALISDYIYKYKKDERKAVQYYYRGLIRIQEDVKMCKSPYANTFKHLIDNELEITPIIRIKIAMKNPWDIYNIYMNELKWDEMNKRFSNPYWACEIIDDSEKEPISNYQTILNKYRTNMRSMTMWQENIKELSDDIKENKDYYEKLIKELN